MKNIKTNTVTTMLTIVVGFLVIYYISKWEGALLISLIIGLIGVFSPFLSKKIDFLWMKLAWVLSLIIPNILLSLVFYLLLFPIALLAKIISKKDPLHLKNNPKSNYVEVIKKFDKKSFEKPW